MESTTSPACDKPSQPPATLSFESRSDLVDFLEDPPVPFRDRQPLLDMTRSAISTNFFIVTLQNPPTALPRCGTNTLGNPAPCMLTPTPKTVAVLSIQLTPIFVWSPIIGPQNCRRCA